VSDAPGIYAAHARGIAALRVECLLLEVEEVLADVDHLVVKGLSTWDLLPLRRADATRVRDDASRAGRRRRHRPARTPGHVAACWMLFDPG
jgi:hypothetical protein